MGYREIRSTRDMWENNLPRFPRKTAVVEGDVALSFAEAEARIERLRTAFASRLAIRQHENVPVLLPNCLDYFLVYWALVKLGAVVVPVNTRLRAEEMRHILGSTEGSTLVAHKSLWKTAQAALAECPNIRNVVTVGFEEEGTRDAARGTGQVSFVSYDRLLATEPQPYSPPDIQPDDLAIIMHTSGTTGRPKGALMRHADLLFNVRMSLLAHGWRHEDVHLLVVPMFHATALYSMLPASAYLGSTVVVAPRPHVPELVALIEKHRCTTFFGVPTLFYWFANYRDIEKHDLASLRLIAYAGSMMPPQTIYKLRERLPNVALHNFFGLTETIAATHVLPNCDVRTHADSIGKPLPEIHQLIVGDDLKPVPAGAVGQLCFHRSNVVRGYWRQPGLIEQACFTHEGEEYFNTGDLAMADPDGYVYLKGRKKEMIIVGGENVYALEVENTILTHDGVMEVAVVGIEATGASAYLGELVKAVVVPKEGRKLTELDIKRHCAERLASYKVPSLVEFRSSLPRNPGGKVLKRELK
ncbi:MAG: acyl--CoA ligase [Planctomycetes bacterium]|nr:acyl--CoA ligase [Planctomycetota bacterium]